MHVYMIDWTETERGWGMRPDGYSFHKTPEDAAAYLKAEYDALPDAAPDEYSFPGGGWNGAVTAWLVDIADNGPLAKMLAATGSTRVFNIPGDPSYTEARGLVRSGTRQNVDYLNHKPKAAAPPPAAPAKPKPSPKRYKL